MQKGKVLRIRHLLTGPWHRWSLETPPTDGTSADSYQDNIPFDRAISLLEIYLTDIFAYMRK